MDEQTPKPQVTPQRQATSSVLPGIAMLAMIVAGIGVFAYSSWRESHPIPRVPADVEPQLKQPGVVPLPARGD